MSEWLPLPTLACETKVTPDRVVCHGPEGRRRDRAEFLRRVDQWQAAFAAREAIQWALYLQHPFEFAAAMFGAWHAGKQLVLPGDDRPATLQALAALGCAFAGDLPGGLCPHVSALRQHREPLEVGRAVIKVFTSGSQGQPQLIDKTLAPLWSEVQALEQAFGARLDAGDVQPWVWATVSHQHIYGLLFLVLWPLASGRPMAEERLLYPEDMIRGLLQAPSILVTTPAHLKRLGEHLDWSGVRDSLVAIFSSGGALPHDVSTKALQLTGHRPVEVFGSSETGGIAWRCAQDADEPWQPFCDVQWRSEGERLAVLSPRAPRQDWWITSDRIAATGAGGFRLLGREDRIVKIEEKRVSLTAVERALCDTPWVSEAKAVVVPTRIGDRVAAVVVLTPEGQALLAQGRRVWDAQCQGALGMSLEAMALPRRWRFVDALPINAQGKTPERLLLDLFVDHAVARPPDMPEPRWLHRDVDEALAVLSIDGGLKVFDGHFPIAPILPGVAQLDWTIVLGRVCFELPPVFVRMEALKFVKPVVPGTELFVSLHRKRKAADHPETMLQFRLYSAGDEGVEVEHASGRVIWRAADGGADV